MGQIITFYNSTKVGLTQSKFVRWKQSTGLFSRFIQLRDKGDALYRRASPSCGAAAIHPLAELLNERGFRALRSATRGSAPLTPASCAQLDQLIFGRFSIVCELNKNLLYLISVSARMCRYGETLKKPLLLQEFCGIMLKEILMEEI